MPATRLLVSNDPFLGTISDPAPPWQHRRGWPGDWIAPDAGAEERPAVWRYGCELDLPSPLRAVVYVSADERYRLLLDGEPVGDGPERCSPERWAYESYALDLPAGRHRLEAVVWSCGPGAPWPQCSVRHGFLCVAADAALHGLLTTGQAPWRVRRIAAWGMAAAQYGLGAGWNADFRLPEGPWQATVAVEPGTDHGVTYAREARHLLRPALLPAQEVREIPLRVVAADGLAGDQPFATAAPASLPLVVAPGTRRRVLLDLGWYAAWHAEIAAQGAGGQVRCSYAEALLFPDGAGGWAKQRRDRWQDGRLDGVADSFILGDGPALCRPWWWRAGRWAMLEITAAAEPVRITALRALRTGYPLAVEARYAATPRHQACLATLAACLHETYMDCPYYEQLQYVGDTRIQAQLTLALSRDDRPVRAAIAHILASALNPLGRIASCHPAPGGQIIPPFALIAVDIVHDLHLWRGVGPQLGGWLPELRRILDLFLADRDPSGLVRSPPGWNYIDAEGPAMTYGVPPGGQRGGVSTAINAMVLRALRRLAELELAAGEAEAAARWQRHADRLQAVLGEHCWDPATGTFRDAPGASTAGPQTQVLAALAGAVPAAALAALVAGLLREPQRLPIGIMFSHHLAELAAQHGGSAALAPLWRRWDALLDEGFTTFPEHWGASTRSDCHAWSAHPLYHHLTGELGIRPDAAAFAVVLLQPALDDGAIISGALPHPGGGLIEVAWSRTGDRLSGQVTLPPGLPGRLCWGGRVTDLPAGYRGEVACCLQAPAA